VRAYQETLSQMGSNCVIFCRERPSFDFVTRHADKATCLLSHDVALSTTSESLRTDMADAISLSSPSLNTRTRELKRVIKTAAYRLRNVRSSTTLNAFRTDVERTNRPVPNVNIDMSHVFSLPRLGMTVEASRHVTVQMARFIDRFDTVRTNRLHVAILATILGKRVEIHDNSYGKLRAVYEHSLRDRFANAVWCEP
jgi:exopolysaccharide biosynthesis predicted pyruvyltransferase EpsI